ncbi:MAG TPA: GntR family transcriptional regulator [Syntrophorhabdaceae bacterium]|nr:GntR family transcriptional regulator [Syntrophorhabdaceae bacterium]
MPKKKETITSAPKPRRIAAASPPPHKPTENEARPKKQAYERALGALAQQIFFREVEPGVKLPTERQLARDLGVDRTSLRVALKHLEGMRVLDIRQGGGIYVRDYQKHAGLEFISTLFQILEAENKLDRIDQYVMDEIWEFWIEFLPDIIKLAAHRHSMRDLKNLMDILDEELTCLGDRERIADLEVRSQDLIAEVANNLFVLLLMNTSRPLRRRMLGLLFHVMDEEIIRLHIRAKQDLVYEAMRTSDLSAVPELYRQTLQALRLQMRNLLFQR